MAERDEVRSVMGILQSSKITNRQYVMDMLCFVPRTALTNTVGAFHRSQPRSFPSNAIRPWWPTFPSRMRTRNVEFRLPLSHTAIVAKDALRMEVTSASLN